MTTRRILLCLASTVFLALAFIMAVISGSDFAHRHYGMGLVSAVGSLLNLWNASDCAARFVELARRPRIVETDGTSLDRLMESAARPLNPDECDRLREEFRKMHTGPRRLLPTIFAKPDARVFGPDILPDPEQPRPMAACSDCECDLCVTGRTPEVDL